MNKKLKLLYKSEEISGILIKEDDNYLTIKLDSGYNAVLKKSNIKKILEENQIKSKNSQISKDNIKKNNSNKLNIKLLHTGGTIASKVDYKTGAVSSKFSPEEILELYPELTQKANIDVELVGNLFSEDMRFSHYNLLLEKIKNSSKYDAVIISHGTDTLTYTATALYYSLENLNFPVILVGAQRSSDRPSSDAYSNLNAAIDFIIFNSKQEKQYLRVGVCMHNSISDNSFSIFDAINLKKLHSTRRDAFKQINYSAFADIITKNNQNEINILRDDLLEFKNQTSKDIIYTKYDENLKIGFFKVHPNLFPEEITTLKIYDAVIIEGTGLGHIAINEIDKSTKIHLENFNKLDNLSKKIPVIMSTQTVYGEVNLNVYSTGRELQKLNILNNESNLISETLFIKIAFCLSKDKSNFKKLFNSNLEGFKIKSIDLN